jgi:hypothetical protein
MFPARSTDFYSVIKQIKVSMNTKSKIMVVALTVILVLAGCGGAEDRKAAHMQRGQAFFKGLSSKRGIMKRRGSNSRM